MNDRDDGNKRRDELKEEEFKQLLGPLYQDGGMVERKACPHCGVTDRLIEIFQEYMVFHRKASPGRKVGSTRETVVFADPSMPPLVGSKIPAFIIDRDICRGCGAEYPVRIYRRDVVASLQAQQHGKG